MNHNHSGGMGKHMLIMLICCLVPLMLIGAVGTFGLSLGPLQGLVPYAAALMCPLMMIVMMRAMMQGQASGPTHHSTETRTTPAKVTEAVTGGANAAITSTHDKCH